MAFATSVYAVWMSVPLLPNSASLGMPMRFSARKIGIVDAIVDGTSFGTTYTPCRAFAPYFLK